MHPSSDVYKDYGKCVSTRCPSSRVDEYAETVVCTHDVFLGLIKFMLLFLCRVAGRANSRGGLRSRSGAGRKRERRGSVRHARKRDDRHVSPGRGGYGSGKRRRMTPRRLALHGDQLRAKRAELGLFPCLGGTGTSSRCPQASRDRGRSQQVASSQLMLVLTTAGNCHSDRPLKFESHRPPSLVAANNALGRRRRGQQERRVV